MKNLRAGILSRQPHKADRWQALFHPVPWSASSILHPDSLAALIYFFMSDLLAQMVSNRIVPCCIFALNRAVNHRINTPIEAPKSFKKLEIIDKYRKK